MNVNVKRAQFQAKVEVMEDQKDRMITFAMASGCEACRFIRGFGKIRLNRLIRGAFEEITAYYEHYGGDPEEGMLPDNVPTLYIGLRNQVKALEVPVEEFEKRLGFSPEFSAWRRQSDREKRKYRYDNLVSMEKVIRSFWYSMIMYLWHTYGWGRERLTRFYWHVQELYHEVMENYLACSASADADMVQQMTQTIEMIEKLGVKL